MKFKALLLGLLLALALTLVGCVKPYQNPSDASGQSHVDSAQDLNPAGATMPDSAEDLP